MSERYFANFPPLQFWQHRSFFPEIDDDDIFFLPKIDFFVTRFYLASSPPGFSFSRCQNNTLFFLLSLPPLCEIDYTTAYHTTATLTLRDLD
jgi:hypothetical protein